MTTKSFNADVARRVEELHDRLREAGRPVTPTEAKVLWLAGQAALAETVGVDSTPLVKTARRVAADLQ